MYDRDDSGIKVINIDNNDITPIFIITCCC